jgi:hypothetical protein
MIDFRNGPIFARTFHIKRSNRTLLSASPCYDKTQFFPSDHL